MYVLMAAATAVLYTVGGVFMKLSAGFSQVIPTGMVYLFFLAGVSLQTHITNNAHLGITYMLVLGLEAVSAVLFSILIFKESYTPLTIVGIFFIVLGTVFLRAEVS
ncbi:DMT family transporter [Stenomitos frigidus]|uniref:Small multidrug resistance protein n=1 Tax=Stenomitos frigidus ULC18 TaxID=2107698 RepID=A0A2T1E446_9CYAN|nr:SMR family transporter [Stenomitos frigidus]PSB27496.1 small multidrug resistance protein [Stenomitos frigidus ULC18]